MTPEHYAKIRELFFSVFDRPPDQRRFYLDQHAASPELRTEVEELLAQHDELTTFLDESDLEGMAAEAHDGANGGAGSGSGIWLPEPGERIGPYVVRRVLGEGGFGMVCEARQTEPVQRTVALKILKTGLDTREIIARFEAERQALAMMDHRFIAKVLDAGATETGRPYFVMEFVPGVPITQFCRDQGLDVEAKLRLFLQVCEAIEHAHQKGIIHRDIKPSNVIVTMQGERTVPKIIDFGIAKATGPRLGDRTSFTAQGQLVGTPAYMSPEQADVGTLDIDTRSDIYSLGALLYQLLVGVPAFGHDTLHGKGMVEIRRILREQEPIRPSSRVAANGALAGGARALHRRLKGDLDWIVLKAMEKDRTRRYATTRELAADIKRHLAFEPVAAGPPSKLYLLSKFARRHRAGVAASVLVAVVVAAGFWAVTWQRAHAQTEAMVASSVIQMLGEVFTSLNREEPQIDREMLAAVTEAIETDEVFADEPVIRGRIFGSMAFIHRTLRDHDQAARLWEQSLRLRALAFGEGHPETLQNMNSLARVLRELGRLEDAEQVGRRALERSRASQGEASPLTLSAAAHLAATLREQGRPHEARPLLEQAYAIQRDSLGEENHDTLASMQELALVLLDCSENEAAVELLEEVVRVMQKVRPRNDPRTLVAKSDLALARAALGHREQAERGLVEVLEAQTSALGADHDSTRVTAERLEELRRRPPGAVLREAAAPKTGDVKPREGSH